MTRIKDRARTIDAVAIAIAAPLSLAACAGTPAPPLKATVTHQEYIPASQASTDECSCVVGVNQVCSDVAYLEKQCWRIDSEILHLWDSDYEKDLARKGRQPKCDGEAAHLCLFPTDFDTIKVGDPFTAPKIKY